MSIQPRNSRLNKPAMKIDPFLAMDSDYSSRWPVRLSRSWKILTKFR